MRPRRLALLLLAASLAAQTPRKGEVQQFQLNSKALAGNLIGDSPARSVSVYLPPSYATEKKRRYPVVYFLHGFTDSDAKWFRDPKHWINLPTVLDGALAAPGAREVIVVMPNALNTFGGSMYSVSATIGDWETFVTQELVTHIDRNFRTLAQRESRGLTGHSMGGYGALRIGMKYPEVFNSLYLLSPCCLQASLTARPPRNELPKTAEEIAKADFGTKAALASAAAWSPNPGNPPFYVDLPVKDGETQPQVLARWAANAPLSMTDQYMPNIRRLRAIAFDAGDADKAIAATIKVLDAQLTANKVPHTYEEYTGNHLNRIAERITTKVIPFFGAHLQFEKRGRATPAP